MATITTNSFFEMWKPDFGGPLGFKLNYVTEFVSPAEGLLLAVVPCQPSHRAYADTGHILGMHGHHQGDLSFVRHDKSTTANKQLRLITNANQS